MAFWCNNISQEEEEEECKETLLGNESVKLTLNKTNVGLPKLGELTMTQELP